MPRDPFSISAPKCSVEGCAGAPIKKGMCESHYGRWKRHGDPLAGGRKRSVFEGGAAGKAGKVCKVDGCASPAYKREMCNAHYIRWHKHGDPLAGGRVKAAPGQPTTNECKKPQCPAAARLWAHLDYRAKTELYKSRAKASYYADIERSRQVAREYAANNREAALERVKEWKTANPEKYRANNARNLAAYREYIRQATPPWTDLAAIDAVYMAAPKGSHVDHIVPIRGEFVCGLHVHWNMQYLTESENCSKRNTFTEADGIDYTAPAWRAMA